MKPIVLWTFLLLLIFSCITPIDLESEKDPEQLLVVEGYLTTEAGPHFIKLSTIAAYGDVYRSVTERVADANVVIRTETGENIGLTHNKQGYYQTPITFLPRVGASYTLIIETTEGERYLSTPQLIEPVPELQQVELRYKEFPDVTVADGAVGLEVYATLQDPENVKNYFMWTRTDGVFPFTSTPMECPDDVKSCCRLVDREMNCFRFEQNYNQPHYDYSFLHGILPDCIVKYPTYFKQAIGSDQLRDGNRITFNTVFIEDDGRRFQYRYRFMLNQLSLSEEAFDYYSLVQSQQSISGDLFDPPPAEIRGNIVNIDNPGNRAIGFFGAYDVSVMEVYASGALIEDKVPQVIFDKECWRADSSVVLKPTWWQGATFSQ